MSTPHPRTPLSKFGEFDRYFKLALATTHEQRNMVYQIRYRVYCEEFKFESTSAFINLKENDEFDNQSLHCLVTHRVSGVPVGCVRVVMIEGNDLMSMEQHAGSSIDQDFISRFSMRRNFMCEVSRLAVDSAFRRRRREDETRFGDVGAAGDTDWERRTLPQIALSLMVGAGALADVLGRKHCFAIMEPFLPIMMRRLGIHFRRVGVDFEFRGVRAPYYAHTEELFSNAPEELRHYFTEKRAQFEEALYAEPMVCALLDSAVGPS